MRLAVSATTRGRNKNYLNYLNLSVVKKNYVKIILLDVKRNLEFFAT